MICMYMHAQSHVYMHVDTQVCSVHMFLKTLYTAHYTGPDHISGTQYGSSSTPAEQQDRHQQPQDEHLDSE